MYNRELDYIEEMREQGKILVIRPSRLIKIGKMERNLDIVKEMYELGREDALRELPRIREFLKQS